MTTEKPKPPETPGMSEVSAKFVDEAEAAAGALPSSASVSEDPVLALKREWEARWELYLSVTDRSDDEAIDPLHAAVNETEYEIFQTPATTLAGIAFKLVLWVRQHVDCSMPEDADWSRPPVTAYSRDLDELPVVSALHDLERMAGEGAAMTDETPIESTPEKSEEILQRYLTWLDIERLNVARIGAYNVQEIEGRESAGIFVKVYRDIRPDIADMPLPDLVARAAKVLETVDLPPADPNAAEG